MQENTANARLGAAELMAAAVGVGLQLATGGEAGTVVGGIVPTALLLAYRLDVATRERRAARAARTLEVAADAMGVELAELERLALRDDGSTSLVARVLAASANAATMQEKVETLGHVLATGLGEGDRLDEALILAAALDDLEAPHVRMLAEVGDVAVAEDGTRRWIFMEDDRRWWGTNYLRHSGLEEVTPALLAVLVRHGLVEQATHPRKVAKGDSLSRQEYAVTAVGTSLLRMLGVQPHSK